MMSRMMKLMKNTQSKERETVFPEINSMANISKTDPIEIVYYEKQTRRHLLMQSMQSRKIKGQ